MLKHSDMTEEARLVFEVVPHTMEVTAGDGGTNQRKHQRKHISKYLIL